MKNIEITFDETLIKYPNSSKELYGVIYMFTSPENKRYIGQTTNWNIRYNVYKNYRCVGQRHFYRALKLYGFENFKIEILCECYSKIELNASELFFEEYYNTLSINGNGYNIQKCGLGKGRHSEETKILISESKRGEKHPMFNKKLSEEHKNKISKSLQGEKNHCFGKNKSEETKLKISKSKLGYKRSQETNEKMLITLKTIPGRFDHNYYKFYNPILMTTFEGLISIFYKKYNLNRGSVSHLLKGKVYKTNNWIYIKR